MSILAIDPGVSNGIAVYNAVDYSYVTTVTKEYRDVYDFFRPGASAGIDQVVIENFAAQRISGYGLHTVRVVGAIEALCHVLDIPCQKQQPQQRLAFVGYAKMYIDKMESGWVIHQADALAHLFAWQYKEDYIAIDNGGLYRRKPDKTYIVKK